MPDGYTETKNEFYYSMFLDTALEDYLVARYAWFSSFPRQFFWSASQTFEKLVKCILVINDGSANFGHNWFEKFNQERLSSNYPFRLMPDEIHAPAILAKMLRNASLPENTRTDDYLRRIDKDGSPSIRYDEHPFVDREELDLYCLDEMFKWFVCAARVSAKSVSVDDPTGFALHCLPEKFKRKEMFKKGNFAFFPTEATDGVLVTGLRNSGMVFVVSRADQQSLLKLRKEICTRTRMTEKAFDQFCRKVRSSK